MSNLFQEISFEKSTVKLARMEHAIVFGFAHRFFELRGRGRELVSTRTFIYCSSMYMRTDSDRHDRCSSMCTWFSFRDLHFCFTFVSYFLVCDLESLELRCKFQRASRPKKEEATSRRGPANCHSRGQLPMALHPLGHPEHGKSFSLLLCHCARL